MISTLRYALAGLVAESGSRIGVALDRARIWLAHAPTAIVVRSHDLSAKITPCGCNAGGWELCNQCDGGTADPICACHRGEP